MIANLSMRSDSPRVPTYHDGSYSPSRGTSGIAKYIANSLWLATGVTQGEIDMTFRRRKRFVEFKERKRHVGVSRSSGIPSAHIGH